MARVTVRTDPHMRAEVRKTTKRVRINATDDMVPDAVRYAPRDTDYLASRIHAEHDEDLSYLVADAEYAAAQELGAQPHTIPNAWGRGVPVEHPGNAAQPYLRPAAYQSRALRA